MISALLTVRRSAERFNEILTRSLAWREALAAYEGGRDKACTDYMIEQAQYHAAEQRFAMPS